MLWSEANSKLGLVIKSQTVSTEKRNNFMCWNECSAVHGGCRFFLNRNTCVLYLRLATHSFVFMGEEEDEMLTFEVLRSCHVKHSSSMELDHSAEQSLLTASLL